MKRPNILYIMSDDHSANAISCYNSIISKVFKTKNIDLLAQEGAKLYNFFATNSICAPARATIMTGQYGHLNGVKTLSDKWNSDTNLNIAKIIQQSGYTTAFFGKWHLQCTPLGFDDYKYLKTEQGNEQGTYYNPFFMEKGKTKLIKHDGYVTDIITDMTINWLQNRNTKKPFFVMCHHKAPHDLWEYSSKYEHLFDNTIIPEPQDLFEDLSHRSKASQKYGSRISPVCEYGHSLYKFFKKPNHPTGILNCDDNLSNEDKTKLTYKKYLKDYLRTVASIDESVGNIINELKSEGELDNTVIIYTSDQGQFLGEHGYWDKRWSFEESLRSPFIIRYPKEIQKSKEISGLVSNIDVAPLLLDYAECKIPSAMQGKTFRHLLSGVENKANDAIYFRYWMHMAHHCVPAHYGIRTDRYKLIYYYGKALNANGAINTQTPTGWELYDLLNDPFENNNIYEIEKESQLVSDLKSKLIKLKNKYKDTE